MRLSDVDAVAGIESRVFSDPWSARSFRQEVLGGRHCVPYVVEEEETGAVVGYAVTWLVADEAHLGNIAVIPEARRRGLGQRMLDRVEADARAWGCRLITLEVRRSNAAARALYTRNGFYPVMVRRAYYADNREDAVVMVKPLTPEGRIPPLDEEAD